MPLHIHQSCQNHLIQVFFQHIQRIHLNRQSQFRQHNSLYLHNFLSEYLLKYL